MRIYCGNKVVIEITVNHVKKVCVNLYMLNMYGIGDLKGKWFLGFSINRI